MTAARLPGWSEATSTDGPQRGTGTRAGEQAAGRARRGGIRPAVNKAARLRAQGDGPGVPARERFARDPRPDLREDSVLWMRLLPRAYDSDGDDPRGLFGALHCLRCCGAALVVADGRVALAAGELTQGEYDDLRQEALLPHRETLTALLRDLRAEAA